MAQTRPLTASVRPGRGTGRPSLVAHAPRVPRAPSRTLRAVFALFVFSVPFETVDFLRTEHTFSLPRLIGVLVILVAVTELGVCFARPPAALFLFAAYLSVTTVVGLLGSSGYWRLAVPQLETLLQLLVLFWIASNILRDPRVARSAITALAFAAFVVAALDLLGIGVTTIPDTGRLSMFGEDPNTIAGTLALGVLAWIALGEFGARSKPRAYRLIPVLVIGAAIMRTGSRGGVVALFCGILGLLCATRERRRTLRTGWTVAGLALATLLGLLASGTNVRRWEATFEEGNLAKREEIFPAAWEMFLERPVTGWGPARNIEELATRTETRTNLRLGLITRDTHNVILWVLTESGVVGAVPYILALGLCVRSAWKGRARLYGVAPFAMTLCVLAINMSVTWQHRKLYWVILGLAAASARVAARRSPRPAVAAPAGAGRAGSVWRGAAG